MRGDSVKAERKRPEPPMTSQPTSYSLSAERESNPSDFGENGSPTMRPDWLLTSDITAPPESKTRSPENSSTSLYEVLRLYGNQLLQSIKPSLITAKQSAQRKVAAGAASRKARQKARELERLRSALIISFPSNREEQARSKAEKETKRKAAEARSHVEEALAGIRLEQERQAEQARLKAEEETKRKAAEAHKHVEEALSRIKAEEERQSEQARLKAEEETKRKAAQAGMHEEAQAGIRLEQERQQAQAEQARLKAEEETKRKAEEVRRHEEEAQAGIRAEQERQRVKAEQARLKAEEETKRKTEEARRHAEAQAIRTEEERQQAQAERARLKDEEETKRNAAEARRHAEAQARIRMEEERQAEQARLKAEEESLKDLMIRRCPKCQRVVRSDQAYCLYDATRLVNATDAPVSPALRPDATTRAVVWLLAIVTFLGAAILVGVVVNDISNVSRSATSEGIKQSANINEDQPVVGGTLNGKETILPNPEYPESAKRNEASGKVTVAVLVDRKGIVVSARALNGHPLLQVPAVVAARKARFAPEKLINQRSRTSGTITYDFK
jgi:TonB family protein